MNSTKAVLRYPGSKWRIADWIIQYIPKHHSYLEPFFGSGAILFNKKPSPIETVNDLDNNVINLFEVLRESPEDLARAIYQTPYSRYEYDITYEINEPADDLEKARRFLVQRWQGHGFRTNGYKVGWKNDVHSREQMYAVYNWYRLPRWIINTADRLKQVQIENMPAKEVIKRFKYDNVFIYADPPYILNTRAGKQYMHEMTDEDHIELLETLLRHPGPVIVSGYQNEIYDELLADWGSESIGSRAEHGKKRTETIWMNFEYSKKQKLF